MPAVARRSRKSRPRWQRRKAARPAEIVTAALDVFVERGFAAARLEEVARRGPRLMAGVIERGIASGEFRPVDVLVAAKLAMSPLMHATVARMAFGKCMPEGFNVVQYLDTHIDLYLHGIAKSH